MIVTINKCCNSRLNSRWVGFLWLNVFIMDVPFKNMGICCATNSSVEQNASRERGSFLYSVILTEYVAMEPRVCVCMYVCVYVCASVCISYFVFRILLLSLGKNLMSGSRCPPAAPVECSSFSFLFPVCVVSV